jgi:hypothetical protein
MLISLAWGSCGHGHSAGADYFLSHIISDGKPSSIDVKY